MDCLEFRRQLGTDPRVTDPEARAHRDGCPFCADACARAQAFETRLAIALNVNVPEGLADRILLAQLTGERQRSRINRRRYGWIALAAAASLALAIGIVRRQSAPDLAGLVASHVTSPNERDALQLSAPLPDANVRKAFADRGVAIASVPAGVAYVSECPVGAYRTVHMVMPKDGEPVSVVYVTHHRAATRADFRRESLMGREVPMGDGTLFLLAQSDARFSDLENRWRDALEGESGLVGAGSP